MDSAVECRLGGSGLRAQEQIVPATRRKGAQAGQQRDPNGLQAYAGRVQKGRHWGGSGDDFERHPLVFGPSPVHPPLDRPSERLGGARVRAKREDCDSGPVFGGDKTREQE